MGFSNGIAELTLKKPPPLVPSSLMTSCEATGAERELTDAAGEPCEVDVVPSVWMTPWETSSERADDRDRQQDVEERAR